MARPHIISAQTSLAQHLQSMSKAASKAMKALGTIRRTFGSLSREGFQILYGTYVRWHLEYCTQV